MWDLINWFPQGEKKTFFQLQLHRIPAVSQDVLLHPKSQSLNIYFFNRGVLYIKNTV